MGLICVKCTILKFVYNIHISGKQKQNKQKEKKRKPEEKQKMKIENKIK